jgi:hypothetical protein
MKNKLEKIPKKELGKPAEQPMEAHEWWIDLLRVCVVLLLIPNHVVCSFIKDFFGPGLYFHVWNETFVEGTRTYIIFFDAWQMHILFLFAGFSLVHSLKKRTFKAFLLERLKRLGIPLLFGYVLWIALGQFVGVLYVYKVLPDVAPFIYQAEVAPTFPIFYRYWWWEAGMVNSGHLWFLVILFLFYSWTVGGVWGVLQSQKPKEPTSSRQSGNSSAPSKTLNNLNLNANGNAESRNTIPSPQIKHRNIGRYVLHPGLVLLYALLSSQFDKFNSTVSISLLQWSQLLFFIFGIVFACTKEHLPLIQKHSKWTFPVSIVSFAVYLTLISAGFTDGYLSILRAIGAWYLIYSLIGMASKKCTQSSPVLRYLSQAAMGIYILHLPLQIIVGYFLLPLSFNPIVKMVVLTLLVFVLSFGLYEGIRRTKLPLLLLCFGITPPKSK